MNMDTCRIKDTFKKADISGGDDTLNTSVLIKDNTDKKEKKRTTEWLKPVRNPTTKEQRQMFGKALEIMLITCVDNHLYQFENKVRVHASD